MRCIDLKHYIILMSLQLIHFAASPHSIGRPPTNYLKLFAQIFNGRIGYRSRGSFTNHTNIHRINNGMKLARFRKLFIIHFEERLCHGNTFIYPSIHTRVDRWRSQIYNSTSHHFFVSVAETDSFVVLYRRSRLTQ